MAGTGSAFYEAGRKYGIDPAFLAAVAMHETGNGASNAVKSKNNVGGMMGKNGLMSFGSVQEGIDAMARNLKKNYFDQGLNTVESIQKKYAPIGAANDPTSLNKNWVNGVTKYYSGF
ncbi:glucosaminidase domain-containing protein [Paenibacillus chitinolyticus]|uniref:glucosaminidase domain-containing protein n=1 Tax=Paenibacillus chitinolyticus TaxID=79263 RepID=UPI0035D9DF9A